MADPRRQAVVMGLLPFSAVSVVLIVAGLLMAFNRHAASSIHMLGIVLVVAGFALNAVGLVRFVVAAKKLEGGRN